MFVGNFLRCTPLSWPPSPRMVKAQAQSPADFYRGKNVELYIGYSVGGGYDLYARMLARHMGKHIPGNPTVVPKNMEGAGSLRLANWLYNVAPKDGTAFGTIGRGTGFDPLLGNQGRAIRRRPSSPGSAAPTTRSASASPGTRSGVTKFDDLLSKELIVGGTGASADTDQFPKMLNGVLGTKMQDRHRLSRRQRGRPRDGARRGAGPLRLVVVEREIDAPAMDRREEITCWCSSRSSKHPGPAQRAADRRSRQDRRTAADPEADLRAPGDGPAVRRAARHPGAIASRRCARRSWTR